MSFRTTYILFGILCLLLIGFAVVLIIGPTPKVTSDFVLPSTHEEAGSVAIQDIELVQIDRTSPNTEKLSFVRDANTKKWKMTQPRDLRVDSNLVDSLVGQMLNARKVEFPDSTTNLKQWDLDPPHAVVILKKGEREWKVNLGSESAGKETSVFVYVTSSDQPKEPMKVRKASIEKAFATANDFRSKTLLADAKGDLPENDIGYVKLTKGDGKPVVLKKQAGRWVIAEPDYGDADMGTDLDFSPNAKVTPNVRSLLAALAGLRVETPADFVEDNASDAELSEKYQLDPAKAELRIEVKRDPDKAEGVTVWVGKAVEAPAKPEEAKDKPAAAKPPQVYARVGEDRTVVRISGDNLKPLKEALDKPAELRDKSLVRKDLGQPDAVNVKTAKGEEFRLRSTGPGTWKVFRGSPGKGQDADGLEVEQLLRALAGAKIEEFVDADQSIDKPVEVSLWVNGLEKPKEGDKKDADAEPKLKEPDKPSLKLEFAAPGDKKVAVRRTVEGGPARVVKVAEEKDNVKLYDKVSRGAIAYLSKQLPAYTAGPDDVTKVEVTRDGELYQIERKTQGNQKEWRLTKPEDMKDRLASGFAVGAIIRDWGTVRADRLEDEQPSKDDLDKKYGLDKPRVRLAVTVKKDDKEEKHEFLLGNETEDKTGVYAKQANRDLVFVVPKMLLTMLQGELLDPTVVRFDPAKVKRLKMSGWNSVYGFPVTLDLERADNKKWEVKAGPPGGFKVDDAKVNGFLQRPLSNLQAKRFLRGGPKPEYELADDKANLKIEVAYGEDSFTLVIGKLDKNENAYYAQVTAASKGAAIPKDVFLLSQEYLGKLFDQPANGGGANYFKGN